MADGFFMITGTSSGIGEAMAQKILEEGHIVLGISRRRSDKLASNRYHHLAFDLMETSRVSQIMERTDEIIQNQSLDMVCLISNASGVEPIGPIEECTPDAIESHVKVGLIAPMILASQFIKKFASEKMRKKIAFISSGAAFTPLVDESVYCSTKAGINMLTQCIGAEQGRVETGFEIISIGPGMVDTPMQQAVRSKSSDEFALSDYFRRAYEDGKLKRPDQVADKIYKILEREFEQGKYVSVDEV